MSRCIAPSVRKEILGGQDCEYCARETAVVIDHVIPVSRGGTDDRPNLAAACWECNAEKSDMTLDEWETWRRSRGLTWPRNKWEDMAARILPIAKRYLGEG